MKNELNGLLAKKMDRLTFLKHVGVGFVALTGVGSVVKTLGGFGTGVGSSAKNSYGYGASVYGGSSAGDRG